MFHILRYNHLILSVFIIIWKIIFAIDIELPKGENTLRKINELVNNYSIKYKTINIYFTEDYFIPTLDDYYFGVPENSNVTLIGNPNNENGTIFDFSNDKFNHYTIYFGQYNGQEYKFENITFINYINPNGGDHLLIHTRSEDVKFGLVFKNCKFDVGNAKILIVQYQMEKKDKWNDYQILFDSCRFRRKDHDSYYVKNYVIKIINSVFYNCSNLFQCNFGKLEIDNCIFNNICSASNKNSAFADVLFDGSLEIRNTIFNNEKLINKAVPFIKGNGNNIHLFNVTMKNVHNEIGFVIQDIGKSGNNNTIYINDSYFENISSLIYGDNINTYISNSAFLNINNRNTFPIIATSKNTYVNSCKITNIKLNGASLFDDMTSLYINNTIIENVTTLYKPIFQTNNKDLIFNSTNMKNITIICDIYECNLISAKTSKNIQFHNVNIQDVHSNGNVIYINGNSVNIEFDNFILENSDSYGAFLKCISENVNVQIRNSMINNNVNHNKFENGLIIFKNNIHIDIINSLFDNNKSHSSGILYFDEIKNLNITIYNSKFINNNCLNNGGTINLIDKNDSYKEYIKKIRINDSLFNNNTAKYFGGILYTNIFNSYDIKVINTNITNNYAGVAGGFAFYSQINFPLKNFYSYLKDKTFNNLIKNNKAKSHGNDFATHPTHFDLIYNNNNTNFEILSGQKISLTLELKDSLNNIVIDSEKYYSNIGVHTKLLDYKNNEVDNYYISDIMSTFSNGLNEINSMKVFIETPGLYHIRLNSKSNYFDISSDFDIKINDCNITEYYKIIKSNNVFYCEEPICYNCNSKYKICNKGNNDNGSDEIININNPEYNTCNCITGRKGINCEEKDFEDTSGFKIIATVLTAVIEVFIITIAVTLIPFKNYEVVKDFGKYSLLSITIGIYIPFSIRMIIPSKFSLKFNLSFEDNILMNNIFSTEIFEKMFKETREISYSLFDINNIKKYLHHYDNRKSFNDYQNITRSLSSDSGDNVQSMEISKRRTISSLIKQSHFSLVSSRNNYSYGNRREFYFLGVPKKKCIEHKSYSCECETKQIDKYTVEEIQSIEEFVDTYNKIFNIKHIFKKKSKIIIKK
ncbi:hypothetical protein PIROE2DRAFT_10326 [Piromyces sp. E2]|nr:hypothetical protein PIROE2DRAFT_10326 [Piromyces sp. E2]|eukprot:OUM63169.1 hypothetical protein PIROE2DRAFT_10326 [Piromyces sp. E2]